MQVSNPQHIRIENFDYLLPDERIAKYPLEKRDQSKLLVYKAGEITDSQFTSLTDFLPTDSLMIFNNTKVIQARMFFYKMTGAQIEIFCLDPHSPNDYAVNFQQTERCSWLCLVGNLKKWKEGALVKQIKIAGVITTINARKTGSKGDAHIVEFSWDNPQLTFADLLEIGGELPIPPYLNRKTEEKDKQSYQTLYSKIKGSVAAPTAGLHFSEEVFSALSKKGIKTDEVTLHVGAGTFKPVKTDTIEDHEMHTEFISIQKKLIENLLNHKGKLIAVGTTSVRTLESLYYLGALLEKNPACELKVSQWDAYDDSNNTILPDKALRNIITHLEAINSETLLAETQIMIVPSYKFKLVNGIVTNFHQPKSTLLLLVSAFVKGDWKTIYEHALSTNYRFLSYGDSSLLIE